ncbi:MAG: DUF4249 domain-containing protein [Flavobacteriales bacterium]|nr:DUF4249 domain-containing protein [Flavobacteriales bacterium]MCX7767733.1 DUF4249 domain-containing protein [Flavobacteriales bacterium]MDW8409372.1 DUF4249 domain-containing protein [Flavobacteriales bacterium]
MSKAIKSMEATIRLFFLVVLTLLWSGCEKDITVELPQGEKKPVVDGRLFSGDYPRVWITYTFPFFTPLQGINIYDPNSIAQFLALDAEVTVSDGTVTEYLSLVLDTTYFPPVFYMGDTIVGQPGRSYFLTIRLHGKTYTAVTTIPPIVALDSLRWKPEGQLDSLGPCNLYFTDPPQYGNIYRLFCKRQGYVHYRPIFDPSVLDDQSFNGLRIEFPFYRPDPKNFVFYNSDTLTAQEQRERFYWKRGDTIYVRFCTIDRPAYEFLRTFEESANTSGNPFSNPSSVKSNIQGGAMGGWVGYGAFDIWTVAQ